MSNLNYRGETEITHHVGDRVKKDGWYVCVPCGYKKYLVKGARFPKCLRCMGKSHEWVKGLEVWEKISH